MNTLPTGTNFEINATIFLPTLLDSIFLIIQQYFYHPFLTILLDSFTNTIYM